MHIIADPQDENTIYIMDVEAFRSTDGGHLFNKVKIPHGDNHGLWIDPLNTRRMIASNDGGVSVTLDGGSSWSPQDNQPTAQFYHVITDSETPYRVYGAQQDSGTVAITSRSDDGSISHSDWYDVGGGEAGYIAPYPPDPNVVYAADYQGNITRYDRHIGQVKAITEQPEYYPTRCELEILRTDTPTFTAYVETRRNRHEEWFKVPAGHIEVCNVPLVTRARH